MNRLERGAISASNKSLKRDSKPPFAYKMQSKYDFSPLSAPPDNYLGLQLFYATRRSRPETTYLFKRYDCPTLAHVDSLVKTALAIVRTGAEGGLQLLEVVPIEEEGGKYTVSFVYRMEGQVQEDVLYRNDGHHTQRRFLEGYSMKQKLRNRNDLYTMDIASSEDSGSDVIVKESCHYVLRKLRPQIAKALLHARFEHNNVVRIVDIAVLQMHVGYAVALVFERMSTDLKSEILRKASIGQTFTETELLKLLADMGSALAYIHGKVVTMQKVAHCNIKPSKVLLGADGNYRLSGFGLAVGDTALALCEDGTVAFMSAEARSVLGTGELYDPYKGDVFALGATLLCAAYLREVPFGEGQFGEVEAEVNSLPYSETFKQILRRLVCANPEERPNIADIIHSI